MKPKTPKSTPNSSKPTNQVTDNLVWEERVKKEITQLRINDRFQYQVKN